MKNFKYKTLYTKSDFENILNKYLFGFYNIEFKEIDAFQFITIECTAPILLFWRYKLMKKYIAKHKPILYIVNYLN